jgi:hypothetical protein
MTTKPKKKKVLGGVAEEIKYLHNNCEALSSNPSIANKTKQKAYI